MATINGTFFGDRLIGTNGDDVIRGRGGNDFLDGRGGNDSLFGGIGDDILRGGRGDDLLDGGTNRQGGDTADYSTSRAGVTADLSSGSAQDGLGGHDTLVRVENITGSAFNDLLVGDNGANVLRGGAGDDTFSSSALPESTGGNDTFLGGSGNDTAIVANSGVADLMAGTITYPSGQVVHISGIENLVAGSQAADMTLLGDDGANTLTGGFGDVVVSGRGGDDTLFAWGVYGDATLNGGDGNDTLTVRDGNSILRGGNGDDLINPGGGDNNINGGAGTDTVSYHDFGGHVEVNLARGRASHDDSTDRISRVENVIGGRGDDTIIGDRNDNRLDGGPGHDTLTGRGGADTFVINAPNEGPDTITDFRHGTDHIEISRAGFGLNSLGAGPLANANFATGNPTTAQQVFTYDPAADTLSFDADGNGGGAATIIARLDVTTFSASDIMLA